MKYNQEFVKYRDNISTQFGDSTILRVITDNNKVNCNDTSNRNAPFGVSWIDYWRAMSGNYSNQLVCSSCGKVIYVGTVPSMMANVFAMTGVSVNEHKAYGGHVWVQAPAESNYTGGLYITPLCPACNNLKGESIPIKAGSILVKELGAVVKK